DRMKKDNYKVHGLLFIAPPARHVPRPDDLMVFAPVNKEGKKEVPNDASLVIVADPGRPLAREVVDALQRYMQRPGDKAGKLLVMADPWPAGPAGGWLDTGLAGFLKPYNVQLGDNCLLRLPEFDGDDPLRVKAVPPPNSPNKIAQQFRTS